jgi:hypothetical protein
VPVDYRHFEVYAFSQWDAIAGSGATVDAPGFEFNSGILPNVQLHFGPSFVNVTAPAAATAYGFGDLEVSVKYRFLTETANRPQIAFYPAVELATGDAARGLGNGKTWYRIPFWVQKSWDDDKWTVDGGGGIAVNDAPGQRDYGFGGVVVQRALGKALSLGAEVYSQGATANGLTPTTFYNLGGTINPTDQFSILFSLGHSVAGASTAIGYFGLYFTFPRAPSH